MKEQNGFENAKKRNHIKARRTISSPPEKKAPLLEEPKKKIRKLPIILTAIFLLVSGFILYIIFATPSKDGKRRTNHMAYFGNADAYDFINPYHEPRLLRDGYTLCDFFGYGEGPEEILGDGERIKDSYNILVVGKDRVGSNTDVIMVVNFNSKSQEINILQVPRDTYVEDAINVNSLKKINAIYSRSLNKCYNDGMDNDKAVEESVAYLEKVVEDTFGITIDSHIMVNLDGFVKIIDAIGGVEMDVPAAMHYDDPAQGLSIHIDAGPQVLDGHNAEGFVRYRSGYVMGDYGRVQAQKLFISALINKLTSRDWFSADKLSEVANILFDNCVTNLKLSDIIGYIKLIDFNILSADSVTMYTAMGEAFNMNGSFYSLYLNENIEIVNKAFNVFTNRITKADVNIKEKSRIYTAPQEIESHKAGTVTDEELGIMRAGRYKKPSTANTDPTPPETDETPTDTPDDENEIPDEDSEEPDVEEPDENPDISEEEPEGNDGEPDISEEEPEGNDGEPDISDDNGNAEEQPDEAVPEETENEPDIEEITEVTDE